VEAGGTISHQHGVGIDHKPYLTAEKGAIGIESIRRSLSASDPEKRLNPDKLLPDPEDAES
jgi:alkyldihydroxyacetonephosphate synthase